MYHRFVLTYCPPVGSEERRLYHNALLKPVLGLHATRDHALPVAMVNHLRYRSERCLTNVPTVQGLSRGRWLAYDAF